MRLNNYKDNNILEKSYNFIKCYLKPMSSIVSIGMIFIVLFSIVFVGVNKSNHEITLDNKINKFKGGSESIIKYKHNRKDQKIRVYVTKENKIKEMDLEQYVLGVVSGEMPASFHIEALKAQAVAARTYAAAHMKSFGGSPCKRAKGADLCDTVHCQVYKSKESRLRDWPKSQRDELWKKMVQAVNSTSGQVLTYQGKLVLEPFYFSTSSGKTENSQEVFSSAVPYLKSVYSPEKTEAPKFKTSKRVDYNTFVKSINSAFPKAKVSIQNVKSQVKVLSRTEAGGVKKIALGKIKATGPEFRRALKLNSANFNISFYSTYVLIDCKGYGHGVGMSQWGANIMAKGNKKYNDILTHYYNNTEIKKIDSISAK